MTKVGAPVPPPQLPVRDRAGARDRLRGAVSPMLTRLATERATGVLERENGTLYLTEGQVVHAESPATPGLDILLTARGPLDPDGWRAAVTAAESRTGRTVSGTLVDSGRLPLGALELCHLGALYDAAFFALGPSSTPGRFRYGAGQAHRIGAPRPVPVAAVERETLRRRALLQRIWPDPSTDTAPLARAESRVPRRKLTARQLRLLELVDGRRTAREISLALGRPAFHTMVELRRLAAAGLVVAVPPFTERDDTATAGGVGTTTARTGRPGVTGTAGSDSDNGTTTGVTHLPDTARQHPDAEPGVAVPGVAVPGVAVPGVAVPGVAVPGVAVPGVAVPGVAVPGVVVPGVAVPGVVVPGRTGARATEPRVSEPQAAGPWPALRRPPSVPRQPSGRHARTTAAPTAASAPAPAPTPVPAPTPAPASASASGGAPADAGRRVVSTAGASASPHFAEPDISLLQRLRSALEAL